MFPKTDGDFETYRKCKPFIGLGLISKIFPTNNTKHTNNYVFDAVPAPREGSKIGLSLNNNSTGTENGEISHNGASNNCNTINENRQDDQTHDQENPIKEERKEKSNGNGKSSNKKENNPDEKGTDKNSMNQTNVVIHNGTNIHFGNVYSTVNNYTMVKNTNNLNFDDIFNKQYARNSSMKMSQPVKNLIKCKNKIENGHLQFLSHHFGEEWKKIGKHLSLTKEEISIKMFKKKEPQERCYQMMLIWSQKPENKGTTLGSLCKILWDSQKKAAQEAVQQLAANLDDLN